jgi:hypothetical protein
LSAVCNEAWRKKFNLGLRHNPSGFLDLSSDICLFDAPRFAAPAMHGAPVRTGFSHGLTGARAFTMNSSSR